jgi:lysophospholipase L1-like esterase
MSGFTYETEKRSTPLENYEWDNVWWEQLNSGKGKRIVYIGDSISCGTRRIATNVSDGKYLFDGFGTSKAVDNPYFEASLSLFLAQEKEYAAIIFNNGLHGWHLTEEEYGVHYKKIVKFLKEKTNVPLILLLSTDDMIHPGINDRIIERNRIVKAIADEFSLPVIDLYEVAMAHSDLHTQDKIHFTTEGYTKIAEKIVSYLDENSI